MQISTTNFSTFHSSWYRFRRKFYFMQPWQPSRWKYLTKLSPILLIIPYAQSFHRKFYWQIHTSKQLQRSTISRFLGTWKWTINWFQQQQCGTRFIVSNKTEFYRVENNPTCMELFPLSSESKAPFKRQILLCTIFLTINSCARKYPRKQFLGFS